MTAAKGYERLVFNPHEQLQHQINSSTKQMAAYFEDIASAVDMDLPLSKAVAGDRIAPIIQRIVSTARLSGFQHGAKYSKKRMPANYGRKITTAAISRGAAINRQMKQTTKRTLKTTPDSIHVLSRERALAAARYEAARGYYKGVSDAFKGTAATKAWVTSSDNPCEECLMAENDDYIGVGEVFSNGLGYPLAHLNCQCFTVVRVKSS